MKTKIKLKYKCIIFDCDGVLVDSEEISNAVLLQMAKEVGVDITEEYAIDHFAGKSLKSTFEYIEKLAKQELPPFFMEEYRKRTFDAFRLEMKPIEGIHDLLEEIQVDYCVASSGPMDKIKLNLTTTRLFEKFEHKSSYDIGSWKPNPEIFEHAAKNMGYKPEECAVIEDSLAGVIAAKKGGFDVFGYANERNKNDFEKEGATVFFKMNELSNLLI
jgi:HAD superfamily hydrolase (TIGR01509 family)